MPYFVKPMSVFMSAEAAQAALHLAGRFLLMVSMTLFLSYVLFMIGAVVVSGLLSASRSVRRRLVYSRSAATGVPQSATGVPQSATGVPQSATPMRQVGSTAKRHEARV